MKRIDNIVSSSLLLCLGLPSVADAHALQIQFDLPVPLPYFLTGAALAVLFSFFVVAFAREPTCKPGRTGLVRVGATGMILTLLLRLSGMVIFGLLIFIGLKGEQHPLRNVVPIFVWAVWWVGFVYVVALVINPWRCISPWRTIAWALSAFTARTRPPLQYPRWLESWPAVILLVGFGWMELIWPMREMPSAIARAILVYTGIMVVGMVLFGPWIWLSKAEIFEKLFGIFGRFAPLALSSRGTVWLRPPSGALLASSPANTSSTAFILVLLSTVTFDGLLETPIWAAIAEHVLALPQFVRTADIAKLHPYTLLSSMAMVVFMVLFGSLYLLTCAGSAQMLRKRVTPCPGTGELACMFVWSLVPIAIVYHVAHYLTYLLLAGQLVLPLASDPFGLSWDLFNTRNTRIRVDVINPKLLWWLSVALIVAGHAIAVWIAHVQALRKFSSARIALASQVPMLILMLLYTISSLWILAQPITGPPL